ncbi:MAG: hypothetical protein H0Z28_09645 [Archaeoglobus sp.]|nr:hypothetical protein [Archaeoglobus sp.]
MIYGLIRGRYHTNTYTVIALLVIIYIWSMRIFPHVHPQYVDKGRILISISGAILSLLPDNLLLLIKSPYLPPFGNIIQTFYDYIVVKNDIIYAILFCSIVLVSCNVLIYLNSRANKLLSLIKNKNLRLYVSIPVIGKVGKLSHFIMYWPIWLGPVHVSLSFPGVSKINRTGLCVLIAALVVTIPSGYFAGERGLREIYYLLVILPVTASLGFYYLKRKANHYIEDKTRKLIVTATLMAFFLFIVILPVVGNYYYHPKISGSGYEKTGLQWLSSIGNPEEGVAGPGYRYMLSIYADKLAPEVTTVATGSELRHFLNDQYIVYLKPDNEKTLKDFYATFDVKYLILSDRVVNNLKHNYIQLDNKKIDKIYSSHNFKIYRHIPDLIHKSNIRDRLNFDENIKIEDAGNSYLVKTGVYRVGINKKAPEITYLGNKTTDLLGGGGFWDSITIRQIRNRNVKYSSYVLRELTYPSITIGRNQIIYRTILKNVDGVTNLATLTVKYTFFEKAIKKEIIIANDWTENTTIDVNINSKLFTPLGYFSFREGNGFPTERKMYPTEDPILLEGIKFDRIFINDGKTGIYIRYMKTSPLPDRIVYSGSVNLSYFTVNIYSQKTVSTSESTHMIQWISIGHEKIALHNIENYTSISLYPYPNGKIPLILLINLDSPDEISKKDFTDIINTHLKLEKQFHELNYTESINVTNIKTDENKTKIMSLLGEHLIGYENVDEQGIEYQEKIISKTITEFRKYGYDIKGIVPYRLKYNIETIKVLNDKNFTFILAKEIKPPYKTLFQEGYRLPQLTYYHGKRTNIILLPVSVPSIPGTVYFYKDYQTSWKKIIDSAVKNEELCVLLWNYKATENGNRDIDEIINIMDYAKKRGMSFTTPYKIAKHFILLQNIYADISKKDGDKNIFIDVFNGNGEKVHGVTFKLVLPYAKYTVKNAQIVKRINVHGKYIYYISTDMGPKEIKRITLKKI